MLCICFSKGAVTEFEQMIIDAGIPIKVPRRDNIGFHVTIGFVNGNDFVVPHLVEELNEAIIWNDEFITINRGIICNTDHRLGLSCLSS